MALKSAVGVVVMLVAQGVYACATCSGPADAPQTQGMNAAILTLFGVLSVVALAVTTLVVAVAWRIRHYHATAPVVAESETAAPAVLSMES
jgi:heme/copper-type cytochrome/quinol oxidase subunit 2